MNFSRPLLAFFALTLMSFPAYAADDAQADPRIPPPTDPAKLEALGKINPYLPKLDKKAREIGLKLDEPALKHLYHVREGFGVLRAVSIVRRDVSAAVKACGKANPDLKDKMDKRFSEWSGAVDPAVQGKETEIDNAIDTQTYLKPKEIKDYMKLIEQTADYANKSIEKDIVTTPEACNSLVDSMGNTQSVIVKTVSEIEILPWPLAAEEPQKPVTTPN